MISYAKNFEDVMLWRALSDVRVGYYIDLCALHPENDSVTKWFYDQGWIGVNVVPDAESFAFFQEARRKDKNVGPSSRSPDAVLIKILQSQPVTDLHFLRLQLHETDREILRLLPALKLRPWVVLVANAYSRPDRIVWSNILSENGYGHVYFDGVNDFFVAQERDLANLFKVPPNVYDHFEPVALVREQQSRQRLEAELQKAATQLATSNAAVAKLTADVEELADALRLARTQLDQIFRSRSWRWLAPIRKANFMLKSHRKKNRATRLLP